VHLAFTSGLAAMRSIFSAERTAIFESSIKITSNGQVADIRRRDGRPCITVAATARAADPVPRRFVSQSDDWRSSIDYLLDEDCSVLAVQLGNRLAVMPAAGRKQFDLYGVHFIAS
jgi:hypothetical protein